MTESFDVAIRELQNSSRRLCQRWDETKQIWDDSVQRQFEKEFWQPLDVQVNVTQRELERLARVVTDAYRGVR